MAFRYVMEVLNFIRTNIIALMLTTDNIRRMQIFPFPINSQTLNYLKKMLNYVLKAALNQTTDHTHLYRQEQIELFSYSFHVLQDSYQNKQ